MLTQNSQNCPTGAGNIVLRGNQLVWLPSNTTAAASNSPNVASGASKAISAGSSSPVKIHVIGASSGNVKSTVVAGQTRTHTLPLTIKVNSAKAPSQQQQQQQQHNLNAVSTSSQGDVSASSFPLNSDHNTLIVHRQPSPTGAGGPSTVLFKGHGMPADRSSGTQQFVSTSSASDFRTSQSATAKVARQPYKILFSATQRENVGSTSSKPQQLQSNYNKVPTPTSGAIMKPIKTEFANDGSQNQLVYYAADASTEEDVHGLTVGANSIQSLNLAGVPSASLKVKNSLYMKNGLRKPCNCTKSMCLKLYCDCFANGEFCKNCNCTQCKNNLANENDRSKAIKSCLERNPMAFQPKIGKGRADTDRLHNKGCNCKKSSCLKNYCECYEAKVACTTKCKCVACRNTEGDRCHRIRSSGLMNLATAAATATPMGAQISDYNLRSISPSVDFDDKPDPKRMPWYYMNDEVIQATTLCLVAQAEQMESRGVTNEVELERAVLREFGRCIQQIIHSASS